MGREVRRVPADWQHPRNDAGDYQPMFDEVYAQVRDKWRAGAARWASGEDPDRTGAADATPGIAWERAQDSKRHEDER